MSYLHTTSRRSFLLATGAVLALPCLESLSAGEPRSAAPAADVTRMVFLGAGYGFTNETFYPTKPGKWAQIGIPAGMAPLKAHQDDLTMVGNLANGKAYDPHFGSTNFLTGVDTIGIPGKDFSNAISCDQVAAQTLGKDCRYASLRITLANLFENNGAIEIERDAPDHQHMAIIHEAGLRVGAPEVHRPGSAPGPALGVVQLSGRTPPLSPADYRHRQPCASR